MEVVITLIGTTLCHACEECLPVQDNFTSESVGHFQALHAHSQSFMEPVDEVI